MADGKSNPAPTPAQDDFSKAVQAEVKAYLDANLEDLVKAAMPPTPEQLAQRERESFEETVRREQAKAARQAKAQAREAEKAREAAAAEQAKRDAAAEKAFADAVPFTGGINDLTDKIVREVRIDDGKAYSAEHVFPVRAGDLIPLTDGGVLLNKEIALPARGRAFEVRGISLVTDAGVLRAELLGSRMSGNGTAVHFPAKSVVFFPHAPEAPAAA